MPANFSHCHPSESWNLNTLNSMSNEGGGTDLPVRHCMVYPCNPFVKFSGLQVFSIEKPVMTRVEAVLLIFICIMIIIRDKR